MPLTSCEAAGGSLSLPFSSYRSPASGVAWVAFGAAVPSGPHFRTRPPDRSFQMELEKPCFGPAGTPHTYKWHPATLVVYTVCHFYTPKRGEGSQRRTMREISSLFPLDILQERRHPSCRLPRGLVRAQSSALAGERSSPVLTEAQHVSASSYIGMAPVAIASRRNER